DPWEQRKLGELTEIKDSARIPNRLWREAGVPYIRASDISQEDLRGALFIDEEDYAAYKAATGAPEKGDVLFNGGGEIGKAIINGNSSPIYVQGGAVLYARIAHSSLLDARYLVAAFVTQNVVNAIGVLSAGGTMKHFTLQPAKNLPIEVPSIAEQRQIGAFFDRLDSLITLHQRKYDKLCVLKKSMLDKMFPKGGSLYPEIRFAGFTDPWEQRKLGELCSFSKGCGYSKNDLRDQGTPIILYGRLYTNYETQIHSVDTFVKPLENSVYSEGGEVIIPASGETAEDISIASVVEKPGIILGGDLNVITSSADIDPVFLALELSYGKPHFDLAKRAQGKSVVHIHNEDIANVFFGHPNIAEQRRIGAFFDRLDSLITLHQRKLELLRNIKKSMLDKMFV
ncbi:restriction endonuclease subunit S, partial [Bifidobacterium adolescentis]|nr:restriction endonuclease subunit S [Bifidobacterium adolescentis]